MIIVENLSKGYGAQSLFDNVSFRLNGRERLGLVGRNGHGKTTLFRIISGQEHPDGGKVTVPRNYTIGYVSQHLNFTENTVLKEACLGLKQEEEVFQPEWKAEKILAGLGFSSGYMDYSPSELSGGYQVRLNLAKVLLGEANLLLLDEPNNYLDITSIRWLSNFLRNWQGELILITHDRSFMDNVVTHTMGIYRKGIKKVKGNTSKLYDMLAMEEEVYEKTRLNDEKKRKEAEIFISRFRAKARLAGMVQSRIKQLEKTEKKEKLVREKELDFSFSVKPFNGKLLSDVLNISFAYGDDKNLFENISLTIGNRERICIIGENGKGKTTLLKCLAGRLKPVSGEIKHNQLAAFAYYEQSNTSELIENRTVVEEILYSDKEVDQQKARNIAGMMMFEGDAALKKVSVLSGGEKNRVVLAKVIATPVNLLLLDEPTNHLDMQSCDALLEALNDFDGSIIMVTHNEMFLHALAGKLIVFKEGKASVFEGDYQRFLDTVGWDNEDNRDNIPDKSDTVPDKKELKRIRSELIKERAAKLKPIEKRMKEIEENIIFNETRVQTLHQEMVEASSNQDGGRISALSKEIHECESKIELDYNELDDLNKKHETFSDHYEKLLQ